MVRIDAITVGLIGSAVVSTTGGIWKGPEIVDWLGGRFGEGRERRLAVKELRNKIHSFIDEVVDEEGLIKDQEAPYDPQFFRDAAVLLGQAATYAPVNTEGYPSFSPSPRAKKKVNDLRRLDFIPSQDGLRIRFSDSTTPEGKWWGFNQVSIYKADPVFLASGSSLLPEFDPISYELYVDQEPEGNDRFFIQGEIVKALTVARDLLK